MHLHDDIDQRLSDAVGFPARSVISTRPGVDRQFNGLMGMAKTRGTDPMEVAEGVAARLQHDPTFEAVFATHPGFLNLRLSDRAILAAVQDCDALEAPVGERKRVILDYGGPNMAKALHVGHLRSLVIGESLRRILAARGHQVVSDIHFGDWGLPMGMLIAEVLHSYPGFPDKRPANFGALLDRLYPEAVEECARDPGRMIEAQVVTAGLQIGELEWVWKVIREESLATILPQIQRLGVHFDLLHGESDARPYLSQTLKTLASHARTDNGATIIDVAMPLDKTEIPPLIFQKGDGGYTYAATDLATILMRRQFPGARRLTDRIIYVVDARQSLHFAQVFRAARMMMQRIDLVHVGFGTVNGPDGKPFRSRDGGTPRLDEVLDVAVSAASERMDDPDLAEVIGIGALKFADLVTHRETGYVFDPERFLAPEGKTGPYLQYACVRLKRILDAGEKGTSLLIELPIERDVLLTCANFPEIVALAEDKLLPNYVAEYAFSLAQAVARFYQHCEVLKAEAPVRRSRLAICGIAYEVLTRCLRLLGIEVPEAM